MDHFTSIHEPKKRSSPEENEFAELDFALELGWTLTSKRPKSDHHHTTSNTSISQSQALEPEQINWSQWPNSSTSQDPIPEPKEMHSISSAAQCFMDTFWEGVIISDLNEENPPIKIMTAQEIQEEAEDLGIIEMSIPDILTCFQNESIYSIPRRQERAIERQSSPEPIVIHRPKAWYQSPGATFGTTFRDPTYLLCQDTQPQRIPILKLTSPDGREEILLEDFP
ncbi:hypothetical protein DFH28DRAFT_538552 [Melampsora americana]|nr:hypothetical protein DFH28DRAFT_538552 [Melampsora americana]